MPRILGALPAVAGPPDRLATWPAGLCGAACRGLTAALEWGLAEAQAAGHGAFEGGWASSTIARPVGWGGAALTGLAMAMQAQVQPPPTSPSPAPTLCWAEAMAALTGHSALSTILRLTEMGLAAAAVGCGPRERGRSAAMVHEARTLLAPLLTTHLSPLPPLQAAPAEELPALRAQLAASELLTLVDDTLFYEQVRAQRAS